jgi:excisionase family DNA binding protein
MNAIDKSIQEHNSTMLTVDEAHERIGRRKISRAGLYNALNRNEIPHVTLGRRKLIPRYAFEQWLSGVPAR